MKRKSHVAVAYLSFAICYLPISAAAQATRPAGPSKRAYSSIA